MTLSDALGMRRSYYALNKDLPIQESEVNDAMWATPDEILKLVHTNKFKATEFLTEILNQNKI